jgi:hypothetical protein
MKLCVCKKCSGTFRGGGGFPTDVCKNCEHPQSIRNRLALAEKVIEAARALNESRGFQCRLALGCKCVRCNYQNALAAYDRAGEG